MRRCHAFALAIVCAAVGSLGLASPAWAAIAVDSQESSGAAHECTTPCATGGLSWSFTNSAGTLLICGEVVVATGGSSGLAAGTASYAGASMSQIGSFTYGDGVHSQQALIVLWARASPATGSNTVALGAPTPGAGESVFNVSGGCLSLTGASGSFGSAFTHGGTTNSTTDTVSVTGTISGSYVVNAGCTGTSFNSAIAPTVLSAVLNDANTICSSIAVGDQPTSGGTVSAGYNITSDQQAIVAVEVFATAACSRSLLGVGC